MAVRQEVAGTSAAPPVAARRRGYGCGGDQALPTRYQAAAAP